jgi:hypothetical protein
MVYIYMGEYRDASFVYRPQEPSEFPWDRMPPVNADSEITLPPKIDLRNISIQTPSIYQRIYKIFTKWFLSGETRKSKKHEKPIRPHFREIV